MLHNSDCGPGYIDGLCDGKCRYPSFGIGCQDECWCEEYKCNPANGCQGVKIYRYKYVYMILTGDAHSS